MKTMSVLTSNVELIRHIYSIGISSTTIMDVHAIMNHPAASGGNRPL